MDSSKKYDNPSPEESAIWLNKLFFCWVLPFFKIGYNKDLQTKDIYNTTKKDLSGPLGDILERNWNKEVSRTQKTKESPSLKRAIWKSFGKMYMLYGVLLFLNALFIKMTLPIVLGFYIRFFEKTSTQSPTTGWLLACGVIGMAFINCCIIHHSNMNNSRIGMRIRIACSSLIYRKLLRLNHLSLGQTAAGQLVNLLSNDVARFDAAMLYLHYIWIMPIAALVGTYVMYSYIGMAAFITMAVMALQAIFGQGYLSKLQGKYRGQIAQLTDQRVKLMSEITSGIQVIKMYAWEKPFETMVAFSRRKEVKVIAKTSHIKGFSAALNVFVERATLYIAVISYVLLDNRITGEVVFSVAQLLNTIQFYMSIVFPMAQSAYEEAKVSIRRIEEFLLMEENPALEYSDVESPKTSIKLTKARASWLSNPIAHTLVDIDLEIAPGTLCCVVGSVGSGKSSLLQVILKELPLNMGRLEAPGRISYAAQEPWLFTSNVRQNILFGMPYIKDRYKEVVKVCALQRDFEELPFGDKTQVGEKGAALSGGQRARVALARAVYRDADAYLLDDPLSAVDAHVAKHLFEECLQKYLCNKIRVLVTHQVQFLKGADLIIVMNNGKIDKIGKFSDLEKDVAALSKEVEQDKEAKEKEDAVIEKVTSVKNNRERLKSISSVISMVGSEPDETQELLEKGSIPTSTYVQYYRAGAPYILLIGLVILLIIAQVMCNASDMWVTYWTNKEEFRYLQEQKSINAIGTTLPTLLNSTLSDLYDNITSPIVLTDKSPNDQLFSRDTYIIIYTIIIIIAVILTSARSAAFYKICMNASERLHNIMFANILKAPMAFFDANPSGRILNRFSKDMGAVDEILPKCTLDSLQVFLVMAGILGMVFIVSPWMIIPAAGLGFLFIYCRNVYLASAQDIKRLEGLTKAPVFSHISASLYGLPSIRSFKAQSLIIREFDALQDQHTATWCLFLLTSETLGFYLDTISALFLALVTFQFLLFRDENTVSGDVGLVIAQSLILTGMLQYGVRQSAEVSSNMTSVERVLQYTKLEEEGPWEPLPADKPPLDWPKQGQVNFKHAYLRYSPDAPPSIKNLTVEIKAGEKVGIVGRTGAGKSSLVATLFRLAPIEGSIEIDGLDTGVVGLKSLRSSISIIPQVPTLFSASLRYNLDPFGKSTDEQLWKALEQVELKQGGATLDSAVSEGGANFSAGQRQLICLARAIVRNNKVLVMDEATANVDQHTDSLIQTTIREAFKDCTVITIAHRLNTIIDCDKVLVMDHGEAVEFAPPNELLKKRNGHFTKMVEQTGPAMEAKLRKTAKEAYDKAWAHINGHGQEELDD
ncbi:unnamed protein product [Ceutorhynchus assimilis]|uniref:Uncharacterized protein n=1 Tax=Ceutorhynchus assimilis TaxID=467358 RepID=A0A9N9QK45_9CUCU|nr:unnamed protein product [Ceutorhynchus assimilis]